MKVSEAFKIYIEENELRAKTLGNYKWVEQKMEAFTEEFPQKASELRQFLKYYEKTLSPESRRTLYKSVRAVARYLALNYEYPNCCQNVERGIVKVPKKEGRAFNEKECFDIIQACSTPVERLLVMVLLETGARISEVHMMRYCDIKDGYVVTFELGKTGSHEYTYSKELKAVTDEIGFQPEDKLFDRLGKGGTVSLEGLKGIVRRLIKKAGITGKKVGAHTFRHTAGTLVADETGDVFKVMRALQQADIRTAQIYINQAEEKKRERVSPLALIQKAVMGDGVAEDAQVSQLSLTSGQNQVVTVEDSQNAVSLPDYDYLYPEPPAGTEIRPKFDDADLRVLRMAFVALEMKLKFGKEVSDARALYGRMLRKVK